IPHAGLSTFDLRNAAVVWGGWCGLFGPRSSGRTRTFAASRRLTVGGCCAAGHSERTGLLRGGLRERLASAPAQAGADGSEVRRGAVVALHEWPRATGAEAWGWPVGRRHWRLPP